MRKIFCFFTDNNNGQNLVQASVLPGKNLWLAVQTHVNPVQLANIRPIEDLKVAQIALLLPIYQPLAVGLSRIVNNAQDQTQMPCLVVHP